MVFRMNCFPRASICSLAVLSLAALLGACAAPQAPETPKTVSTTPASGPARPAGGHGHAAFMGSYDTNRDGVVTRSEYDTVRKQRFQGADTNGDGWLSEDEYVAEFEKRLKQQYADESRSGTDAAYTAAIKQAHVRFGVLDKNNDGHLTWDEEQAMADKTFQSADRNGDGVVNAADAQHKR